VFATMALGADGVQGSRFASMESSAHDFKKTILETKEGDTVDIKGISSRSVDKK
jgi:NAD(P)H-dependent flavin oxidoreductase YrpB (nitropropane dioxygenase family)